MIRRVRLVTFLTLLAVVALGAQNAKQPAPDKPSAGGLDPGETVNGIYRNVSIGFSYRLPYGWVDRTDEMREASTDPQKSTVLLASFERPPQASGTTVNSAVVFAAEAVSSYPGLKSAAQYFGPLTELTSAKGLQPVNEPYEFPVDGKPIVRRDFVKQHGSVGMHQSTLALLGKGYIVSFTFIGGSDEEVQELIEWLRFALPRGSSKHASAGSHP